MGKPVGWGVIKNFSVHGISIDVPAAVRVYDLLDLQLFLGEATHGSGIGTRGFVVRRDHQDVGIRFIGLDFDSFKLLKTSVAYIANNETMGISQFLQEMKVLKFSGEGLS